MIGLLRVPDKPMDQHSLLCPWSQCLRGWSRGGTDRNARGLNIIQVVPHPANANTLCDSLQHASALQICKGRWVRMASAMSPAAVCSVSFQMLTMRTCCTAVESLDEPGAAEEAQRMRLVLAGLLRDFAAAAAAAESKPPAAAAASSDDQSMVDCLAMEEASDLGSVDLDALLESKVKPRSGL